MSEELRHSIAEQVLGLYPDADKNTWGRAFLELAAEHDMADFEDWQSAQLVKAAAALVTRAKTTRDRRQRDERLLSRGVTVKAGRPITPSISVRADDGSRQTVLWVEATPRQFMDAVLREQAVVDGRAESNAIRMQLAELLQSDKQLMSLASLREVCAELEIDPDTLGLDELGAA